MIPLHSAGLASRHYAPLNFGLQSEASTLGGKEVSLFSQSEAFCAMHFFEMYLSPLDTGNILCWEVLGQGLELEWSREESGKAAF
jgi:hypothetical protein